MGDVPDLSQLGSAAALSSSMDEILRMGEMKAGMRCGGCGERFQEGWEYVTLAPVLEGGHPVMQIQSRFCCLREECDYREKLLGDAVARRPVEWQFLRPEPGVAPD